MRSPYVPVSIGKQVWDLRDLHVDHQIVHHLADLLHGPVNRAWKGHFRDQKPPEPNFDRPLALNRP